MTLDAKIEALLFLKGEPVTISFLSKILEKGESEVEEAIAILKEKLEGRGVVLMEVGGEVSLGTHPEVSEIISRLEKAEADSDLSKASLETLTIILYRGPISKAEIDFIRGVNSAFILRNLLIRGLVLRETDPKDRRGFVYSASVDLLSHLGITEKQSLPSFENTNEKIEAFKESFSKATEDESI